MTLEQTVVLFGFLIVYLRFRLLLTDRRVKKLEQSLQKSADSRVFL